MLWYVLQPSSGLHQLPPHTGKQGSLSHTVPNTFYFVSIALGCQSSGWRCSPSAQCHAWNKGCTQYLLVKHVKTLDAASQMWSVLMIQIQKLHIRQGSLPWRIQTLSAMQWCAGKLAKSFKDRGSVCVSFLGPPLAQSIYYMFCASKCYPNTSD